jgi:hypothetical protein
VPQNTWPLTGGTDAKVGDQDDDGRAVGCSGRFCTLPDNHRSQADRRQGFRCRYRCRDAVNLITWLPHLDYPRRATQQSAAYWAGSERELTVRAGLCRGQAVETAAGRDRIADHDDGPLNR